MTERIMPECKPVGLGKDELYIEGCYENQVLLLEIITMLSLSGACNLKKMRLLYKKAASLCKMQHSGFVKSRLDLYPSWKAWA